MKAPKQHRRAIPSKSTAFKSRNESAQQRRQFYQSAQWRQVRKQMKQQAISQQLSDPRCNNYEAHKILTAGSPLCESCLASRKIVKAYALDHIKPRAEGGHATDPSNLQWLCKTCHGVKSAIERNRYG